MKRLLILDKDVSGLCWYRGFGALDRLRDFGVQPILHGEDLTWRTMRGVDALFMLRPCYQHELPIIALAQQMGIKVWCDWDDPLMDVPPQHPDWEDWQDETMQSSWMKFLISADFVTTTTSALKENLKKHGAKDPIIVPNAIDEKIWPTPMPSNKARPRMVMWRGGKSHGEDLMSFLPVFVRLQQEDVRLVFFGAYPKQIGQHLRPGYWSHIYPASPAIYMHALREYNAPVHVIPLIDNELNRCKSNVAYLEASWLAGSVCVHPDWHNIEAKGTSVTYEKSEKRIMQTEHIVQSILEVLEKPDLHEEILTKAQSFVRENHFLGKTTQQRLEILNKML